MVEHSVNVGDQAVVLGDLDGLDELLLGAPVGSLPALDVKLAEVPDVVAVWIRQCVDAACLHVVARSVPGRQSSSLGATYWLEPLVGAGASAVPKSRQQTHEGSRQP
jgi:hypothetical protein